jgi:hypothetical protein
MKCFPAAIQLSPRHLTHLRSFMEVRESSGTGKFGGQIGKKDRKIEDEIEVKSGEVGGDTIHNYW